MLRNEGGSLMPKIELLSPAKNLECAVAAINHGADAVYIGGPSFGARAAAGNSFEDLEKLLRYAHPYHAKVFVTLNTILTDKELEQAERQIQQYYDMGIDALIVQDMGILKLNLPPIALHASTQADNRDADKVRFLKNAGFQRVVLARELSLQQIETIHKACDVELEAFVHGALCVSYSGRCYMSYAACGRSANRGECAQFCRLPYSLVDAEGKIICEDKHLLSLKDLDRSDFLLPMMQAGVTSFKIEGRLKDANYVKNITAYYRRKIDDILNENPQYQQDSIGKTTLFFDPDPERTFHRSKTDYFVDGVRTNVVQLKTPKSTGAFVGVVKSVNDNSLTYSQEKELHNGDGLCFVNSQGEFSGFRANRVEGRQVFFNEPVDVAVGDKLYRNYDIQFEKLLNGKSAERRIAVDFELRETSVGLLLCCVDEAGTQVEWAINADKVVAEKEEQALKTLQTQLSKLGNTSYVARKIDIKTKQVYFFPSSQIAEWRRSIIDLLIEKSLKIKLHPKVISAVSDEKFPIEAVNVYNDAAVAFYQEHGIDNVVTAYEKNLPPYPVVMTCKHCIRFTLGICKKHSKNDPWKEPLFLKTGKYCFQLSFDCVKCEMNISMNEELDD